jgi:hypothetical protein
MSAGSVRTRPASYRLFLKDEVSPHQPTARLKQAAEQRGGDGKRRVGNHRVRAAGEPEIRRISPDDHGLGSEAAAEVGYSTGVGLEGDDPGPGFQQRRGDDALAGAYVEDPAARPDQGLSDDTSRPLGVQFVPSPPLR